MLISILVWLTAVYYSVQLVPGVFESLGYVLGLFLAPYLCQLCFADEGSD